MSRRVRALVVIIAITVEEEKERENLIVSTCQVLFLYQFLQFLVWINSVRIQAYALSLFSSVRLRDGSKHMHMQLSIYSVAVYLLDLSVMIETRL